MLEHWEKITFRIFGLFGKDARTKVGDYTRLAQWVLKDNISKENILVLIDGLGIGYTIDLAVKEIRGEDCYNGWENDLRYLFYRYEEYLAARDGSKISKEIWEKIWNASPTTTIEHIYPQNPNSAWKGKLGRGRNRYERFVNCLGNLMILPPNINSKARAQSFSERKAIYKQNYLRLMDEILTENDWTYETIQKREESLLNWIKATWC